MIEAYRDVSWQRQDCSDGPRWRKTIEREEERGAPSPTTVPDTLHDIDFMAKDSTRFAKTGGWGYAQFNYDAASETFTPLGIGAACGFACHTA